MKPSNLLFLLSLAHLSLKLLLVSNSCKLLPKRTRLASVQKFFLIVFLSCLSLISSTLSYASNRSEKTPEYTSPWVRNCSYSCCLTFSLTLSDPLTLCM